MGPSTDLLTRATVLLRGGYNVHEVASILELEFPNLDEFQREDLPILVDRINGVIHTEV
jgi:hypothetical protein